MYKNLLVSAKIMIKMHIILIPVFITIIHKLTIELLNTKYQRSYLILIQLIKAIL